MELVTPSACLSNARFHSRLPRLPATPPVGRTFHLCLQCWTCSRSSVNIISSPHPQWRFQRRDLCYSSLTLSLESSQGSMGNTTYRGRYINDQAMDLRQGQSLVWRFFSQEFLCKKVCMPPCADMTEYEDPRYPSRLRLVNDRIWT